MFAEFLNETLLPALLTILTTLVTVAVGIAVTAIREWGAKQKQEWIQKVTAEAATAVENAVQMVNQTFTQNARDVDGKISLNQSREAMSMALIAAQQQLGVDGMKALGRLWGAGESVDANLRNMIEAAVHRQKPPKEYAAQWREE